MMFAVNGKHDNLSLQLPGIFKNRKTQKPKLEELFVIRDIDAWTPQIRSKTAIRSGKKHIFIDPSIGIAALGLSPDYFNNDLDLFGHIFENLVLRDLLVFAEAHDARILHYTDDTGLEADAVYQMEDGNKNRSK